MLFLSAAVRPPVPLPPLVPVSCVHARPFPFAPRDWCLLPLTRALRVSAAPHFSVPGLPT